MKMTLIGNIIWFIGGGFITSLAWALCGLLCCITVVGIPLGKQCFKVAKLALAPFGKEVSFGGGAPSLVANIIWLLFCGWELALSTALAGVAYCITIIGIPLGLQYFKFAKIALLPFGAKVE